MEKLLKIWPANNYKPLSQYRYLQSFYFSFRLSGDEDNGKHNIK